MRGGWSYFDGSIASLSHGASLGMKLLSHIRSEKFADCATTLKNPTIEEQALARIHRIGQRREVTTVRFYIQGSFEERVMEVQESKKNLAGVLLSGHDGGQADDSLGALQVCFLARCIIEMKLNEYSACDPCYKLKFRCLLA